MVSVLLIFILNLQKMYKVNLQKTLINIHIQLTVVWPDNEAVLQLKYNYRSKMLYVSNNSKVIRDLSFGYKL